MSNDAKVVATSDTTKPSLGMRLTCLGSAPIGSPLDARDHALIEEAARALRTAWSEVRAGADLTSDADAAAVGATCYGSPSAVAVSLDAILTDKLPSVTEPVKHTLHAAARSLGALYAEVARVRARRLAELEAPASIAVVAAVILRDAKVLLVVSKKHGEVVTPGGRVEPGETHADAIRREVREETGLTVKAVGRCLGMEQRREFAVHFYVTEVEPGEPVAGDDAASVRWGEARETKDRAWVLEALVDHLTHERDRLQRACDEGLPRERIDCPACGKPHVEWFRHDAPGRHHG